MYKQYLHLKDFLCVGQNSKMAYTQLQKVGIVFVGIISFCIVYSLVSKRMYEPFATSSKIPMKMCKKDSDCPAKFACKNSKCVSIRPM